MLGVSVLCLSVCVSVCVRHVDRKKSGFFRILATSIPIFIAPSVRNPANSVTDEEMDKIIFPKKPELAHGTKASSPNAKKFRRGMSWQNLSRNGGTPPPPAKSFK